MNHHHSPQEGETRPFWISRYAVGMVVLGAIATYFLLSEHRAHFFGALPFLLLLACPLMHVFMHRGHGGHGAGHADPQQDPGSPDAPKVSTIGDRP